MPEGITLKRIIDMDEAAELTSSDYALVDSATGGPKKFALGNELSSLKEEYTQILDSAYVTDTASGSIASFPDGADGVPVKSLTVDIEPVQDLHGQESPWPAGGGVNLLPPCSASTETKNGITLTSDGNGKYTLVGTATASALFDLILPVDSPVLHSGQYVHVRNSQSTGNVTLTLCDVTSGTGRTSYFGLSPINRILAMGDEYESITIKRLNFYVASGTVINMTIEPSIEATNVSTDFTPYSNICPISGHTQAVVTRCGKNLFDFKSDYSDWSDGYLRNDGIPSGTVPAAPAYERTSPYIEIKGGQTYIFSFSNVASATISNNMCFYDKDKNFVGTRITDGAHLYITGTAPENAAYVRVSARTFNGMSDVQLELGSTATAYEPYQGQTVTIDLDDTIYGGTLDVGTGVLTVDRKYVLLNNPDKWENGRGTVTYSYGQSFGDRKIYGDSFMGLTCSIMPVNSNRIRFTARWEGATSLFFGLAFDGTNPEVSLSEVKALASNGDISIVYDLAEPLVIQLTAEQVTTLKGQNNIWSDTGNVEAEYRADTKLYIEKLTAPTEDDMIADHAISANSFFMVGNTLYRAITAIASGATITVGTNATKLSLSDALNALA